MKRRDFILGTSAALAWPMMAQAKTLNYRPGLVRKALEDGKTVMVRYGTSWCSTCNAQKRRIEALRQTNPNYDENIMFVYVDFDQFGTSQISTKRGVFRHSTLILLKGDKELGRLTASTSEKQIKAMMDEAVSAASA